MQVLKKVIERPYKLTTSCPNSFICNLLSGIFPCFFCGVSSLLLLKVSVFNNFSCVFRIDNIIYIPSFKLQYKDWKIVIIANFLFSRFFWILRRLNLAKTMLTAPSAPITAISYLDKQNSISTKMPVNTIAMYAPPYAFLKITEILGTVLLLLSKHIKPLHHVL